MSRLEPTEEEIEAWNLAQIKQRRSNLHAKPIGSVMRKLMSQRGYAAIQATSELHEKWSEIVGDVLARLTCPGNIARGVLQISVSDNGAMQELYFRKKQILTALKAQLPEAKVEDLRFRVGKVN
jgi:predicted nucleic acid-binding Zn ribbon protein